MFNNWIDDTQDIVKQFAQKEELADSKSCRKNCKEEL